MKKKKSSNYLKVFLLNGLLACSLMVYGQPPDDDDPVNTPFDGGVSLLVAAAVGYGAKKVHDEKKIKSMKKEEELK